MLIMMNSIALYQRAKLKKKLKELFFQQNHQQQQQEDSIPVPPEWEGISSDILFWRAWRLYIRGSPMWSGFGVVMIHAWLHWPFLREASLAPIRRVYYFVVSIG
jgi:hypothetical protein